jgi:endo-alpha-N-acetylgalactosaminidase
MKFKTLFSAVSTMGLLLAVAHAAAPEVLLESKTLAVSLDSAFPRIVSYQLKAGGATFAGQAASLSAVELNGKNEPCQVRFSKRGADVGEYRMSFGQSKIDVTLRVTVGEEAVDLRFTEVKVVVCFPRHRLSQAPSWQPWLPAVIRI